jgi:two-component system, LytTR family, sensor kinase
VGALLFAVLGGLAMGALDWALSRQDAHTGFRTVVGHDIVEQLTSFLLIYGLIVAAVQAVAYGRESRERQLAGVRLQRELAEARLNAVTTQLQPHFLFNTLNAVSVLVRSDPARAERTIGRLSDLLRYALTSVDDTRTTMHEEVRFLEKYVEIQQARFGDRLLVTIAVDARAEGAVVPRLLLQPLVENAIRHGISPRAAPGHVEIRVSREGDRVRVLVCDDGVGLPASAVREGVGLTATRARLRQEYDADYEFTLGSRGAGGAVAMVAVPYRDS